MVLVIAPEEYQLMKMILLDQDKDEALKLIKHFVDRLDKQSHQGMKSHLDR